MDATGERLRRIYARRFPEERHRERARLWRILVEGFFQRWIRPQDTVLDLGCGFGEFLNAVRCARRIGVDLNEEVAGHLDPAIEFHRRGLADLSFLPGGSVDVVFTSNVLEHLPSKNDVEEAVGAAHDVLKPGGLFIALGPNVRFLPGGYWDFWDHHVPLSDRSIVELLELVGFEVQSCISRFLPYTTCSSLPQHPALVRLYLRLPIAWRLFGRQFLVRARRTKAQP